MTLQTSTAAALAAGTLSLTLTEVVRRVALRRGLTDRPAAHKAHARPTPYLGGVALVLGTLIPTIVVGLTSWNPSVVILVITGITVSAVGLVDDLAPLRPGVRLLVEGFAATLVVLAGIRLDVFGNFWLDAALTTAWIVLVTNSFNLLDNMDAAAASVAGVTAGTLCVAAVLAGRTGLALLLVCLAGSCIGFLAHNRPPARIFMGDAGSLFIGFVIAISAVACAPSGAVPALAVLLLATFVAVVDTCLVVISRQRSGRSWLMGGTDHASHRLCRLGLRTGRIAALLALVAALSGVFAVLVARAVLPASYVLVVAVVGAVAVVRLLLRVPVYADQNKPEAAHSGPHR